MTDNREAYMSKPVIKTAEERMQEWTAATELDSFIQLSAAQFRDFLGQEVKELRAALEASQKENVKLEDELDEYKEHHEELTEHYKALQFLESEFRKENDSLNVEVSRLKNELIASLKDWHDLNANQEAQQNEVRRLQAENAKLREDLQAEKNLRTTAVEVTKVGHECSTFLQKELEQENEAQAKRIAELEQIKAAAEKLVNCKGRYHTEQNMIELAKLFDAQKGRE